MGNPKHYKQKELDAMENYLKGKHKHNHCDDKKEKDSTNVAGFDFDVLKPRNVEHATDTLLTEDVPVPVANVTLRNVKKGDVIWLNGVLGLENRSGDSEADVLIKIYKGNDVFLDNQEIYNSDFDIGTSDDEAVAPISHVDVIKEDKKEITCTLTVTAEDPDMYLIGPVTFTGLQIREDH